MTPARAFLVATLSVGWAALPGCMSPGVPTTYGKMRSDSVNGTGVLAGLFRARGHEVRAAVRLTDELRDWAEVIVRFAPAPGAPPRDEALWYDAWLNAPDRRLVYVPRDYDATPEYWTRALADLPATAPGRTRERIEEFRKEARRWESRLPPHAKHPAAPDRWFAVKDAKPAQVCKTLGGPWAEGVDPGRAALTRRETIKGEGKDVLLSGDGEPLVVSSDRPNHAGLLVAAGGVFLLNVPLVERARWPLAERTIDWAAGGGGDGGDPNPGGGRPRSGPKRVAFVEGFYVLEGAAAGPSVFALLKVSPFGRVAAQLLALGLAACLARAPRLGRPRPKEPSGADRPVAHPEALGALLARTGQAREARSILETYRRWRHGPSGRARPPLKGRARRPPTPYDGPSRRPRGVQLSGTPSPPA